MASTKINIVVGSAPGTEEDEEELEESEESSSSKSTKIANKKQHFHHHSHGHGHHRHHHRHHRFVPKKLDLSSAELEVPVSAGEAPKKSRNKHHTKYRRSASITTSNHSSELDKLRKKAEASNQCWKDTLSVSDANQLPEGATAGAGAAAGALPRTLSTSVLRIKHRRTFWERCARYDCSFPWDFSRNLSCHASQSVLD